MLALRSLAKWAVLLLGSRGRPVRRMRAEGERVMLHLYLGALVDRGT